MTDSTDEEWGLPSTTLVCVKCLKAWTFPHECDVVSGETLVRIVKTEDYEIESEKS